jgi:hypothetical protein
MNTSVRSLRALAESVSTEQKTLPSGRTVEIETLSIAFPLAEPSTLPAGATFYNTTNPIPGSYLNKPLVLYDGQPLFGEIAVARALEKDGWSAVWVDTYHSRGQERLFWNGLPDRTRPVVLNRASPVASQIYEKIRDRNRGGGGFFDVLAWRGADIVFIEYKGKGDASNVNELRWIDSALSSGLTQDNLGFVFHPKNRRASASTKVRSV